MKIMARKEENLLDNRYRHKMINVLNDVCI